MPGRLDHMTSADVLSAAAATLLVPLGSVEQHGPHLPLGTDSAIAEAWADAVAAELDDAAVAPVLPFGSSGEHQSFAGTLSIGQDALASVLVELARSAANDYRRVVFLSGHAGNAAPLQASVATLREEGHNASGFVPHLAGADAHAGRTETSIMLAIDPTSVRLDNAEAGNTQPLSEIMDHLTSGRLASVAPNGVLGDPAGASAEAGRQHLAELVSQVLAALGSVEPEGPSQNEDC